jgi:pimeloyl-ACP methyl ester carboxylesterase
MQIALSNVLIEYDIFGEKNYEGVLVVLHGWGRNKGDWKRFAETVSVEKRLQVILIDLPGFGGSTIPTEVIDSYDYSRYVMEFISKLGIKKYSLLGHSFGGKVAIIIAAESDNVERLFLVSPSGILKNYFKMILGFVAIVFRFLFSWILPDRFMEKFANYFRSKDYKQSGEMSKIFKKTVNQGVTKEAKNIGTKTLIVWGSNDKETPLAASKKLRKLISESSIRIVWEAGHNSHLDKEDSFIEIISENL